MTDVGLIVVAAGSSTRMGGVDKLWADLGGRPLIWHSLHRLTPLVTIATVVVRADQVERTQHELLPDFPELRVVAGGEERQDSVRCGLDALPPSDVVAVHDAARPLVPPELLLEGIGLMGLYAGALPTLAVRDTIKQIEGRLVRNTVDRTALRAAQTPQVFRAAALRAAHEEARSAGFRVTDDAAAIEATGSGVCWFEGDPQNFKVTDAFDLRLARIFLAEGTPA